MFDYDQLCGALGMLKTAGVDLDWPTINDQMREIGLRVGIAEFGDPHADTRPPLPPLGISLHDLHRKYRDECLVRGLIRRGELFNDDDCMGLF